jgi:hypothetical protein
MKLYALLLTLCLSTAALGMKIDRPKTDPLFINEKYNLFIENYEDFLKCSKEQRTKREQKWHDGHFLIQTTIAGKEFAIALRGEGEKRFRRIVYGTPDHYKPLREREFVTMLNQKNPFLNETNPYRPIYLSRVLKEWTKELTKLRKEFNCPPYHVKRKKHSSSSPEKKRRSSK